MSADAFVARQAIVDREHRLVAYELLFRSAGGASAADELAASYAVVSNALLEMGTKWLLGDKLAFVNMGAATLRSELPVILPPDKVVIEILEDVVATPALVARVRELRERGYRFALDDYDHRDALQPLLPHVAYVKLDVLALPAPRLAQIVAAVRAHPVRLLAEKVETRAQFDACLAARFDLFQGYYFARPETMRARVLEASQALVLELLERVQAGAEVDAIEALFRRDVALTTKLLRYVNSAGFGLRHELRSLRHVITLLGRRPLARWLVVLLATAGRGPAAAPLARTAIVRGRLCELLGGHVLDAAQGENLFVTGVLSLLDALLGMPMADALARLALPATVAQALSGAPGAYRSVLDLAVALESQDVTRIALGASALGLDPAEVNADHLSAIVWVERLGID